MPILSSFIRLVRYHIGSVAFGSFIIALIQLVSWAKIGKNNTYPLIYDSLNVAFPRFE